MKVWILYLLFTSHGISGPNVHIQKIQVVPTLIECETVANALRGKINTLRPNQSPANLSDFYCHETDVNHYTGLNQPRP